MTTGFLIALVAAVANCASAEPAKPPRIAYVALSSGESSPYLAALQQGLRDRGWRDVVVEDHSVRRYNELPDSIAKVVKSNVDVIVTNGGTATQTARKATATIPIVTVFASDPVEAGVATTLARPGQNVTGLTTSGQALVAKRMELLKAAIPALRRVAVLWNSESLVEKSSLQKTEAAAKVLNLEVRAFDVNRIENLQSSFAKISAERIDAVAPVPSTLFLTNRKQLASYAAQYRLPSTFSEEEYVEAGGLMSYGPNRKETYRQLAIHVDKILKGAKAGDLPFEEPTNVELVINLKTAKALGITIPRAVLLRADHVIE